MEKHEIKVAKNIRQDKSRGKKLWDNIDKLIYFEISKIFKKIDIFLVYFKNIFEKNF